jgi:thiamine pyrophosphokinase
MARFVIFCAAGFENLLEPIDGQDFILAADGGLTHLQKLGIEPHEILGDFDSLGYVPQDARVFPVEKDDTDAMLAARRGLELGYREFLLYGTLDGPRLDHTVANIQLLHFLATHGATGFLIGNNACATVLQKGTARFAADAVGYFSLFCLGASADGITLTGSEYTLENASLSPDFPLGVSNRFIGKPVTVSVKQGAVLLIWERQNGLCRIEQF